MNGKPPNVSALFEDIALDLIGRGCKRYSSDRILHKIRDLGVKVNDHMSSHLARRFMAKHRQHGNFFQLRKLRANGHARPRK